MDADTMAAALPGHIPPSQQLLLLFGKMRFCGVRIHHGPALCILLLFHNVVATKDVLESDGLSSIMPFC
jgi:hypothetical protein